jgi:hypothetical protein
MLKTFSAITTLPEAQEKEYLMSNELTTPDYNNMSDGRDDGHHYIWWWRT